MLYNLYIIYVFYIGCFLVFSLKTSSHSLRLTQLETHPGTHTSAQLPPGPADPPECLWPPRHRENSLGPLVRSQIGVERLATSAMNDSHKKWMMRNKFSKQTPHDQLMTSGPILKQAPRRIRPVAAHSASSHPTWLPPQTGGLRKEMTWAIEFQRQSLWSSKNLANFI